MEIAYLGWGSLTWDPRNLKTRGDWKSDGPSLPVEFMRFSGGGRITLVISPGARKVRTLWARADFDDLDAAIENLRAREDTVTGWIGFITLPDCASSCRAEPGILEHIQRWAEGKGLDAVVWTDLPDNPDRFKQQTGTELNEDNVIKYLGSLKGKAMKDAREYVQKAPEQIDTNLRRRIKKELGW
jgi:hypothetical protein